MASQDSYLSLSLPPVSFQALSVVHPHGSLLSSPPAIYHSEQTEFSNARGGKCGERSAVCISPFRSVQQMREPLPLVLQSSPSMDIDTPYMKEPRRLQSPTGFQPLRSYHSDPDLAIGSGNRLSFLHSLEPPDLQCVANLTSEPKAESSKDNGSCETKLQVCPRCPVSEPAEVKGVTLSIAFQDSKELGEKRSNLVTKIDQVTPSIVGSIDGLLSPGTESTRKTTLQRPPGPTRKKGTAEARSIKVS
jgi:hypothetical protein